MLPALDMETLLDEEAAWAAIKGTNDAKRAIERLTRTAVMLANVVKAQEARIADLESFRSDVWKQGQIAKELFASVDAAGLSK